ncbi:replication initiation protein [Selenomonas sp. AE3005]|uniref:replication initiation protein n=1 Tax=Selenomonas sp. AE3005 TaxID=1485543 RepID=UPI0004801197|nr:replication initiation protein [Selenomonas sp. AE3005]
MNDLLKIDENKPIKQSNRLIEAKYKLTKYEQRMILAICSQLNTNAKEFSKVRVSVADMAKFCNYEEKKGYTLVKNTIMRLLTRTLQIKDEQGWYATHWLQSARYIESESVIEYCVDEHLKTELLQLKQAYLSTSALPLMEFRSDYTTRFYLLLKKMLKVKDFEYELDFIRERFQLGKSYNIIQNLKSRVIEPAMAEINEKSDINVKHEYIKQGRSYTKIHFTVTLKKEKSEEEKMENDIGQLRLNESFYESDGSVADRLVKRGVSAKSAKQIAKKYDTERINRNLKLAINQKDTAINLGGLITTFIKEDTAGANMQAQRKIEEREKERLADDRQAKEFFYGKTEDIKGDYAEPVKINRQTNTTYIPDI